MKNTLQKLSRTKYHPSLIDLISIGFVIFGLIMGLLGKPKTTFYGLSFGIGIFVLRLIGVNRSLILWLTAASLFQLTGEAAGWYQSIPYFDKIIHTVFPIIGSLVAYAVLVRFGLAPRPAEIDDRHPQFTLSMLVFLLAVTGGALWEVLEFTSDTFHLFPSMLQYGNTDTMGDIVATFVGSLAAGWLAVRVWPNQRIKVRSKPTV